MISSSQTRKKIKITHRASAAGVNKIKNAMAKNGYESIKHFAKKMHLSRNTVGGFVNRGESFQLDTIKRLCDPLGLKVEEVIELEQEQSNCSTTNDCSSSKTNEDVEQGQTSRLPTALVEGKVSFYQLSFKNQQDRTLIRATVILAGDLDSIDVRHERVVNAFKRVLKTIGLSIEIEKFTKGSIKLHIEGSPEDIERLRVAIDSGELEQINNYPIIEIKVSEESSLLESFELNNAKWDLVRDIVSKKVEKRELKSEDLCDAYLCDAYLSNADLSNADLSGADLSGADLSNADLSNADLSGADLNGTNLRGAILSYVNLSCADLSCADLSYTILRGVDWRGTIVSNTIFSADTELSEDTILDLKQRGATFAASERRQDSLPLSSSHDSSNARSYNKLTIIITVIVISLIIFSLLPNSFGQRVSTTMKVFLGTAAVTTQKVKEWSEILLHILKGYPQVPDRQTSEISDNEWTIEVSTAQRQRLISQSYEEQDDFITEE